MSFVDDLAGDAAAIVGEQGINVTYTPDGGVDAGLTAIVDPLLAEARTFRDGRHEIRSGVVQTLPSDTPTPSTRDKFTIGGVVFAVVREPVTEWLVEWQVQEVVIQRQGGAESHVERS